MEDIKIFKKGEQVFLKYEIDGKLLIDDTIYYTLKNPTTGTFLKNCAFTADELIPVNSVDSNEEKANG